MKELINHFDAMHKKAVEQILNGSSIYHGFSIDGLQLMSEEIDRDIEKLKRQPTTTSNPSTNKHTERDTMIVTCPNTNKEHCIAKYGRGCAHVEPHEWRETCDLLKCRGYEIEKCQAVGSLREVIIQQVNILKGE